MKSEQQQQQKQQKQQKQLQQQKQHPLFRIFLSTLYLSTFTFGGGYVIVSLLKQKFVDELHWIEEDEMLDLVAIAQSSPGAIAVNGAIVIGYRLAGLPGVACAILGAVLPPFVILTILSYVYDFVKDNILVAALLKGMSLGVSAVILSVTLDLFQNIRKQKDLILIVIMILAFAANYFYHVNIILIILICIGLGLIRTLINMRKNPPKRNEV